MFSKSLKIILILGIVAVLAAIPSFWLTFSAASDLEVDFLDIGQGDAILIKSPYGQNILIDGGPDNTIIKRLGENLPWWDKQIDLVILSHPHDDHVAGLIDVIKRYKVKRILYTGAVHTSPAYLELLDLIKNYKIPLTIIDRPQVIKLGEKARLNILYPKSSILGQEVENLNNSSIVIKLVYGQNSFLFTGDAEVEVEQELLARLAKQKISLAANVLKAGHHGSDTSSSKNFLEAVNPEIVVIQSGKDNDFGHPSRRVLKRLERINAKILRNDLEGTIKLVSDGEKVIYSP